MDFHIYRHFIYALIIDFQRVKCAFVEMAGISTQREKCDKIWTYICIFRGLHKVHILVHKNKSLIKQLQQLTDLLIFSSKLLL